MSTRLNPCFNAGVPTPISPQQQQTRAIRTATETDAETIAQLSGALGYSTTGEVIRSRLHALLRSQNDLVIVATNDSDAVIGWLQAHASHVLESDFRVEITGLIVVPETRRQGVGRTLVTHAEQWAQKLGAEAIVVRSNVQRTESHAFYPALGYNMTKTQTVYRKKL